MQTNIKNQKNEFEFFKTIHVYTSSYIFIHFKFALFLLTILTHEPSSLEKIFECIQVQIGISTGLKFKTVKFSTTQNSTT